ncbi:hypothetical protein B0T24DRAFT_591414 [Lasiosphaeria ovina]|uniref:Uncharacterized protein n=1 Tax=Lasiosphaeria ovina TaxID=92902 RepID=A0AAE0KFU7_9PEZI|nr:hypothetical protein B0T24DRAFT_591414 [Lasiosphaeria ovina]
MEANCRSANKRHNETQAAGVRNEAAAERRHEEMLAVAREIVAAIHAVATANPATWLAAGAALAMLTPWLLAKGHKLVGWAWRKYHGGEGEEEEEKRKKKEAEEEEERKKERKREKRRRQKQNRRQRDTGRE